ncbi:MAG: FliM/FliN family flagellar motor switch protein [Acidobacteriaceae bacterium]|nr:FliM/FliN family flagellar motor switch protein [Acidobacteriaceae bacterium]
MPDHALSDREIDSVMDSIAPEANEPFAINATPYDFRRTDRIATDQLRSVHSLHENFCRSTASSLSAYLRTYVATNLVSVEQLSFSEILRPIATTPTCIVSLRMQPNHGSALLHISNSIVFPIIEMLLGGSGQGGANIEREPTEIERSILDSILRLVLKDLEVAWETIAEIEFVVEAFQSGPQLFQYLPPNEALLAVSMEMRIGAHTGLMNIWIPSIVIKMLRQKFVQQVTTRRGQTTDQEHSRMLRRIRSAEINVDVRLNDARMLLDDLVSVEPGDVIRFDHPLSKPIDLHLNGMKKFSGRVVSTGSKRGFQIATQDSPE